MTKSDIAKQIAADRLDVRTTRASEVAQQVFDGIAQVPTSAQSAHVVVMFKLGRAMQRRVAPFVEGPRPSHALMPVADHTALR